ncbi:unnamed protein product [Medioppia subpectinata]|uniref:Carboxylic ester hydrolase n=1 Tax=Medioppia subpectinata TaxID=1979941 RepID=A0A7R9LE22_9ACAR|nr:unnamed protein product [Medioppia subpectinata]CAG2117706.1 unnamed protein product [Medioppia subpectinata]
MLINTQFILNVLLIASVINYGQSIDVNTTSGAVRGQTLRVLNREIHQFLGIPFAEPPVGALRFARPVPISTPQKTTIDATVPKNSCIQIPPEDAHELWGNVTTSEDCLVLNIWTPQAGNAGTTKPKAPALKPVMFWIYGGGLTTGSIFFHDFNGSVLAANDVVLVAPNYRLGPFGFLYGDRKDAPGNVGFYDQLLALKWVRENIHKFGGDRDQITIFGQSAGGWSVSAHIISPRSKGLFSRAILESGSYMNHKDRDVINKTEALLLAKDMAQQLKCSPLEDWLRCLRRADPKDILKFEAEMTFPVEDTEFLPISAQKAFALKKFNQDIDLMAGVVRDEGSGFGSHIYQHIENITADVFHELVLATNKIYHGLDARNVTDFYLNLVDTDQPREIEWAYDRFVGDLTIKCPTYVFAKQFAKNNHDNNRGRNVYFYELTYESKFVANVTNCERGICHTADVPFVFGMPFIIPDQFTQEETYFSKQMIIMWTNFAKTG